MWKNSIKSSKNRHICLTFVVILYIIYINNIGESMAKEKMRAITIENSIPLRIDREDRDALNEIKAYTGIPVCKLIHIAIPLLRRKYRIKSEDKGE